MVPDFIVVMSVMSNGSNKHLEYVLSQFSSTEEKSAYRVLKEAVLSDASMSQHVNWVSVNLVIQNQLITFMQGSLEWFKGVEYFKKLVGDMGGSEGVEPSSYGFIDQKHNIRVEFENGIVALSEI